MVSTQEVVMSKLFTTPTSRLICFGGAKACTNSPIGEVAPEDDFNELYNP